MNKKLLVSCAIGTGMFGIFGAVTIGQMAPNAQQNATPFAKAVIYLEYNATDEDTGVHIDTDHGAGIAALWVVSPKGKTIVEQEWTTLPKLGLTEMSTESAEPDLISAINSYKPGVYKIYGRTINGQLLFSRATLSHVLLDPPEITYPPEGATGIPAGDLIVTWDAVAGAQRYALEVEGPGGKLFEAFVTGTATSFHIPAGILSPNGAHKIGVASEGANRNLSLSVVEFTTGN